MNQMSQSNPGMRRLMQAEAAGGAGSATPWIKGGQAAADLAGAGLTAWLSEMQTRRAAREQRRQFQQQMEAADLQQRRSLRSQQEMQERQLAAAAPNQTADLLGSIAGLTNNNMDWAQRLAMVTGAR